MILSRTLAAALEEVVVEGAAIRIAAVSARAHRHAGEALDTIGQGRSERPEDGGGAVPPNHGPHVDRCWVAAAQDAALRCGHVQGPEATGVRGHVRCQQTLQGIHTVGSGVAIGAVHPAFDLRRRARPIDPQLICTHLSKPTRRSVSRTTTTTRMMLMVPATAAVGSKEKRR